NTTAVADDSLDGNCDLWEAMQAVFQSNFGSNPVYHECTASAGPNVIGFSGAAAGGTIAIPVNMNLPFAWGDTTLLGPIAIDGGGLGADHHIFELAGGANITFIGVVIKNAHASGAGPAVLDLNGGTVTFINSSVTGNTADNDGGAIDSNGNVNINTSNFSGN